jgi:hypothetical protein
MQRKPAGVRSEKPSRRKQRHVAKNLTVAFDVLNVVKTSIPAIPNGASQIEACPTLAGGSIGRKPEQSSLFLKNVASLLGKYHSGANQIGTLSPDCPCLAT